MCTYLKQNLILLIDFACSNCTSIECTKEGTRILTLKRKNVIEVTENELRILVPAQRNITIPPRIGGIFHIDINAAFDTNQVLTLQTPYFQEMPNVYPHEIVLPPYKKRR